MLFHFLFEALRLDLLPPVLARAVADWAAAVERNGDTGSRAAAARASFLDQRDALGLEDLAWDETECRGVGPMLARAAGGANHRAAAGRLGRSCEELSSRTGDRKATGAYYTPAWAADAIAETLVRGLLKARGGPEGPLSLKLLDPAAGAGAFPVAAIEAMARAAGEGEDGNDVRRAAARECIFAVEMDPLAAMACRLAVWLSASRPGRLAVIPRDHVHVRDALGDSPPASAYDIVLGNPPWGVKLPVEQAAGLSAFAPEALAGHRDSFLFFLHLAAGCVRADGAIGLVLPDAVLWQVRYQATRRALLERFRLLRIVLVGNRLSDRVTAPACLVCLVGKDLAPGHFYTADLRRTARADLPRAVTASGWSVSGEEPVSAPQNSFLLPPTWLNEALARLRTRHPSLGEMVRFTFHDVGINYARAELGRALLYSGPREHPRDVPVTRGRDFAALTLVGSSPWLRHDWRERVGHEKGVSVREPIYRMAPKILLRQTGDRPIATVDRQGVHFGRSVIGITGDSERDLLWLAALVNSAPFAVLYRALAPEAGRAFAQVKVNKLKLVPVPEVGEGELAALAARILDQPPGPAREALFARLDAEAARAYGLTEEEAAALAATLLRPARRGERARRGGAS